MIQFEFTMIFIIVLVSILWLNSLLLIDYLLSCLDCCIDLVEANQALQDVLVVKLVNEMVIVYSVSKQRETESVELFCCLFVLEDEPLEVKSGCLFFLLFSDLLHLFLQGLLDFAQVSFKRVNTLQDQCDSKPFGWDSA